MPSAFNAKDFNGGCKMLPLLLCSYAQAPASPVEPLLREAAAHVEDKGYAARLGSVQGRDLGGYSRGCC